MMHNQKGGIETFTSVLHFNNKDQLVFVGTQH